MTLASPLPSLAPHPCIVDLGRWTWRGRLGMFDTSTGLRLLDGSVRSPGAALVRLDRWQAFHDRPVPEDGSLPRQRSPAGGW